MEFILVRFEMCSGNSLSDSQPNTFKKFNSNYVTPKCVSVDAVASNITPTH